MPDPIPPAALTTLEKNLAYSFKDPELLRLALTHPSCAQEDPQTPTNQRLEFLGDAALGFILADKLYRSRPEDREGALTQARSVLAQGKQLATLAARLGVPDALLVSPAEREQGGHRRSAALEDALEAIVGAIYLDGGMEAARGSVLQWFGNIEQLLANTQRHSNAKGRLQEFLQGKGLPTPEYRLIRTEGPDHDRTFTAEVWFQGNAQGRGSGSSIKAAEEAAAADALPSEEALS